jgi:hypothetical protein
VHSPLQPEVDTHTSCPTQDTMHQTACIVSLTGYWPQWKPQLLGLVGAFDSCHNFSKSRFRCNTSYHYVNMSVIELPLTSSWTTSALSLKASRPYQKATEVVRA